METDYLQDCWKTILREKIPVPIHQIISDEDNGLIDKLVTNFVLELNQPTMSDINELPVNPQTPEINCLEGQGYADGCDEQDGEKIKEDDEMIIGLNEHNPVELSQLCNTSENDALKSSSDINQQEVESAND